MDNDDFLVAFGSVVAGIVIMWVLVYIAIHGV